MKLRITETNEYIVEVDENRLGEDVSDLDKDELQELVQDYVDDWYGGEWGNVPAHLRPLPAEGAPAIIFCELGEGGGVSYEFPDWD